MEIRNPKKRNTGKKSSDFDDKSPDEDGCIGRIPYFNS